MAWQPSGRMNLPCTARPCSCPPSEPLALASPPVACRTFSARCASAAAWWSRPLSSCTASRWASSWQIGETESTPRFACTFTSVVLGASRETCKHGGAAQLLQHLAQPAAALAPPLVAPITSPCWPPLQFCGRHLPQVQVRGCTGRPGAEPAGWPVVCCHGGRAWSSHQDSAAARPGLRYDAAPPQRGACRSLPNRAHQHRGCAG